MACQTAPTCVVYLAIKCSQLGVGTPPKITGITMRNTHPTTNRMKGANPSTKTPVLFNRTQTLSLAARFRPALKILVWLANYRASFCIWLQYHVHDHEHLAIRTEQSCGRAFSRWRERWLCKHASSHATPRNESLTCCCQRNCFFLEHSSSFLILRAVGTACPRYGFLRVRSRKQPKFSSSR